MEVVTVPVTEQLRRRCQARLDPGERIRYLIPTVAVGIGISFSTVDCFVVVTERRIVVLVGETLHRRRPLEISVQLPRATRLGPVEFTPAPTFHLGSHFYEIDDEYVPVVLAADAELDGPEALPHDPFPEL